MAVWQHPWHFETDTPHHALAGRDLLEQYLADRSADGDIFSASIIFGELVGNVVKHAPGGGVRIWLEPEGDRFALCIHDGGCGFGERELNTRSDESTESGRGLRIVREMSEALSFGPSNGSGFLVRAVLPVRRRPVA